MDIQQTRSNTTRLTLGEAQQTLTLWIYVAALPLLLFFAGRSADGYYSSVASAKEVWAWLLPLLLPPMLVPALTVLGTQPFRSASHNYDVDHPFALKLTKSFIIVYFGAIYLTVVVGALSHEEKAARESIAPVLGIFENLVTFALGMYFGALLLPPTLTSHTRDTLG